MPYRYIKPKFNHGGARRGATKWIVNEEDKTFSDAVYPRIPFLIRSKDYRMKVPEPFGNNESGQLKGLAIKVTDLFREERLVMNYNKATELRPHAERLIHEAMRNGDKHRPTMALANFWLIDKSMIHKLFKELVPRYLNCASSFTAIHRLGMDYDHYKRTITDIKKLGRKGTESLRGQVVLELRGNSLPPIVRPKLFKGELLTNVLLSGARKTRQLETREAIAAATSASPQSPAGEQLKEEEEEEETIKNQE